MGGYYLCRTRCTRHPFYIESIGRNIYSLEELCYYLSQYVYLIDETILNQKLCAWLGEELGLVRLQKILLRVLERQGTARDFILPLFQECGYLKRPELLLFQEQLAQIEVEPASVRKKMKADYLMEFGLYVNAIEEYERILAERGPGRLGTQFYAEILENEAAAYARLFEFEEAADCLWNSYQTQKSRKVYEKYLRILPLFLPAKKYQQRLEEIRADREQALELWEDTKALMREGQNSSYAQEWKDQTEEERISGLKEEYRRWTAAAGAAE